MRIVCYAVNGSGVGHVMRQVAIARNLRKLSPERGINLEIFFLTSSEAAHLLFAEHFPAFKFPSRNTLLEAGILTPLAPLIKGWAENTLRLLQPDLFIVDTFPEGYYDELPELLQLSKHTAVIHRPVKFANLDQVKFYQTLALYDLIIVPEAKEMMSVALPAELENRTHYFGPVMAREREQLLEKSVARQLLNIDEKSFVVYLSAGGGGDWQAERQISEVYESLRGIKNVNFVIGAGSLYRGKRIYADDVVWLTNENAFELMNAFDAAVAATGYNTFNELMFAGVPSVFLPQEKWADDQLARAQRAENAGAGVVFREFPGQEILLAAIGEWLDTEKRHSASHAAQALVPYNHACDVASYLIQRIAGDL